MPIVGEAIIKELEDSTDYEYQFSAKFERKMRMLIWKEAHPWGSAVYRLLNRTAILGICVVGVLFFLTMSVEGNRVKFFETVRTMWEDSELYTYFTDGAEGGFQEREPAYVPEGYREVKRELTEIRFLLVLENSLGEMITWEQLYVLDEQSIVLDTEYDSQVTKDVDGKLVTVCAYSDGFKYAYCEHANNIYIATADNLETEDIYKMFVFGKK